MTPGDPAYPFFPWLLKGYTESLNSRARFF